MPGPMSVIGHHAHIVRGIAWHRGKPIFHGLGNGCVVTRALSPAQDHPARAAWAERRKVLFGFEPDPAYHLAPFHPEAVNAMLGWIDWHADGSHRCGDRAGRCRTTRAGRCWPARTRADQIARYVEAITVAAGLPAISIGRRRPRGTGGMKRLGIWLGGMALLAATLLDTVAVIGRNAGFALHGAIELIQAAVLVAGGVALVMATVAGGHARVHLLLDRLASPAQGAGDARLGAGHRAVFRRAARWLDSGSPRTCGAHMN